MLAAATLLRRSPERERRCGLSCRGASGCWIAVGDLRVTRIRVAFCRGEAWAVATLEDGTLAEPACSALAEYRWARDRLEVLFFFAGYWQAIAAAAAAGGGGRSAQEEERLMLEGLVAEIELRHGVAVGSVAAVGPRRGQRVHVLDPYWTRDWAAEELAGRRLPASLEQLEEERLDNVYDKAGFLSFMEFGGFDLRQDGAY